MRKEGFKLAEIEIEHLLQLISIYISEWDHRATALWNQVFKYFYATLIVLFLPNMANHFEIDLSEFPKRIFPVAALLLSFAFLLVSLGCAKRAKNIGDTYKKLTELLPEEFRRIPEPDPELDTNQNLVDLLRKELFRVPMSEFNSKLKKTIYERMSFLICWMMFFVLAGMSFIMLFHYKGLI